MATKEIQAVPEERINTDEDLKTNQTSVDAVPENDTDPVGGSAATGTDVEMGDAVEKSAASTDGDADGVTEQKTRKSTAKKAAAKSDETKTTAVQDDVNSAEQEAKEPDDESGALAEAGSEPEIPAETESEPETPAEAESEPETLAETESEPETLAKEESEPETLAETEVESVEGKEASESAEVHEPSGSAGSDEPSGSVEAVEGEAAKSDQEESDRGEGVSDGEDEQDADDRVTHDYSERSKEELVAIFAGFLAERPVQTLRADQEAIKVAFYKLHRAEVDALRKTFLESGGVEEDFAPPTDVLEQRLKDLFAEYRRKRDEYTANIEKNKEENLRVKLQLIEELKELVNSTETMNATFNAFRAIQQRWRETGLVPQASVKDLWETYNLHVENFYNYIKINKELRDLDLKRNYEAKLRLCEESEALMLEPSIVKAFHKLQKLHEQWRETGPVANEFKEVLWERFKEASSRINKRHQEHFETLKDEQKRNLELKAELCAKTEELAVCGFSTRKEWDRASDKLIEIQKVWKTIGYAPKKDNTRIYDRFRRACDVFFEQKRNFYQQFKDEMDQNMQQKVHICEMAETLKDSTDWKKATDELIELQRQWKAIGPVARRHSDAVWKRFRAACDAFFERKQAHFSTVDTEYEENLKRKEALLAEIEAFDIGEGGFDAIKDFQRRWGEIGFVPIKQKDAIQKRYKEAMDVLFGALRGSERDRRMDRFRGRVNEMKGAGGGDRKLRHERDRLYNKVKQLESDIATLENNIGFFARSKNADAMIAEVNRKIEEAKSQMEAAIEKINVIDSQE